MSDAASYKQRKEDFVSNLSGGSVTEIGFVTSVAPVAVLLWSVLQARQSFFTPSSKLGLLLDFLLNIGAILLATTLYSGQPVLLNLLLLVPVVALFLLPPNVASSRRKKPRVPPNVQSRTAVGAAGPPSALPMKPFLTTYRGCMMVVTCVAILAVDFRLFPRRFAKVETWGTSLMDMGVGSFVFSAGVVTARPSLKEKLAGRRTPLTLRLLQSLRHSLPLLGLGLIRLLSVKGLDYAEHVTEYGVHWNFFFTLGLLPPFVALFHAALAVVPSHAALALLISGTHQALLQHTRLTTFVLTASRTDLLSMNREGLCSFVGYLAIFLAGQDLGHFVIPRSLRPSSAPGAQRNTLLMAIAVWAAIWTALYLLATSYSYGFGLTVSRRLANLPYVLWVAAFNCWQMLAFCLVDSLFFPGVYNAADATTERLAYETATSTVLRAYNRNGLALFLLANLLTGLINMTVSTLDVTPITTILILLSYTATVTAAALILDKYDISIKL